jgi:hypothetical protein
MMHVIRLMVRSGMDAMRDRVDGSRDVRMDRFIGRDPARSHQVVTASVANRITPSVRKRTGQRRATRTARGSTRRHVLFIRLIVIE